MPTTRVAEEGRSQGKGQSEQFSEILPQNKKVKKWLRDIVNGRVFVQCMQGSGCNAQGKK